MINKSDEKEMLAYLVEVKKAQKLFGFIPYKWFHDLNFELELILIFTCGLMDYLFSFNFFFMLVGMIIWWEHFRISEWRIDLIVDYTIRIEDEQALLYEFPDDFGPDFKVDDQTKTIMQKRSLKKYPKPRDLFYLKESRWSIFFTLCYFILFELIFIYFNTYNNYNI